jgi:hypothetical protein
VNADYRWTSLAMIEKHNGAIFGAIPENSVNAFLEQKPKPFPKLSVMALTITSGDTLTGLKTKVKLREEIGRGEWI